MPVSLPAMSLADAIVELRYAKDWSPQTTLWYRRRFKLLLEWCATQHITTIDELTLPVLRRYTEYLQTRPSHRGGQLDSVTVHGHVATIRTLLFWAASEGLVDDRIPQKLKPPKVERKVLQVLSDKQLDLLFRAASQSSTPLRDTAIVSLLLDTGVRVSELCGVTLADVHFEAESAWLLVHGKGRKQRPIALGKKARLAVARYLHRERASDTAYQQLFLGKRGPLTRLGVERVLYRLRDAAGAEHFTTTVAPHRWRHTHAVKQLLAGQDIYAVSKSLGHSSIGVTTNYLQAVSDYQLMEKLSSPLDQLGK